MNKYRILLLLPEWLAVLIDGQFIENENCPVCGQRFTWADKHIKGRLVLFPSRVVVHAGCKTQFKEQSHE